jgi:hypothetical protein
VSWTEAPTPDSAPGEARPRGDGDPTDEFSLLQTIERRVQERARDDNLDLAEAHSGPDNTPVTARLRALIGEEIEHWHEEWRRGRRPLGINDPEAVAERALRNLAGYGPLQPLLG